MATKIFVGGLKYRTAQAALRELFEQHGTVTEVDITRSDRSAIVEMPNSGEAMKAIMGLNTKTFDGQRLKVTQAGILRR